MTTIRSMPPSRAYDEGWDRTFGRADAVPEHEPDREVQEDGGSGEAAGGDDGGVAPGDAATGSAAAPGVAGGAAAEVEPGSPAAERFARVPAARAVADCGCGYGPLCPEQA